jgi:cyclophilin family peptidyl-prolyl cis-trans isomerase/HEAT repeat protein
MKRVLTTLVVLLLFAVVGYFIYDQLREPTVNERIAEVLRYEDSRLLGSNLKTYLDDPSPQVREKAALAVGRIGGAGTGELLLPLLADSSLDVMTAAALGLGLSGDTTALRPLLQAAFDLPSRAATAAVRSIGWLADSTDRAAHDNLVDYLVHPSPDTRQAACYALFNADARTKGADLVMFVRKESDELARAAGIYALARMGLDAPQLYQDFMADADPFVRQSCVRGLGRSSDENNLHYLAMALNDGDDNVVIEAIRQLGTKDQPAAHEHLWRRLERTEQANLIVPLLSALQTTEAPLAIERAKELVSDAWPSWVIGAAARYLATVEKDRTVPMLDSLVQVGDRYLRTACAEAYELIKDRRMIARVAALLKDSDPMVREAAFGAAVALDSTDVLHYVDQALNDTDWVMVSLGVDQIGERLLEERLPVLITLSEKSDTLEVDIRRSLVSVAGQFLERDPGDSLAQLLLADGLLDPNHIVQREAIDVYAEQLGRDYSDRLDPVKPLFSRRQLVRALKTHKMNPSALVKTNRGDFEFELYMDIAPLTVLNFIDLAGSHFYEGLTFHRIVPGFVAQGGDPRGDGWGGPPRYIRDEYSLEPFLRGTVGIATSGKDTGGSQFFVTLSPQPHLEGRYTVFGQVVDGMDVVDRLIPGDTIKHIYIQ